jgi:hypothetical protein
MLGRAAGITTPSVGIDDQGRALIAWYGPYKRDGKYFSRAALSSARVRVGSTSADSLQRLPATGSERLVESGPSVRVNARGNAIVVWEVYGKWLASPGKVEVARATTRQARLTVSNTASTENPDQSTAAAIGPSGDAIVAWSNQVRPTQAVTTPSTHAPFGAAQPISSRKRESATPSVAIDAHGHAIALWWDLGSRARMGLGYTPLLSTEAKLR